MERYFALMVISSRNKIATGVQEALTRHGCFIKTRLGLHEGTLDQCSDSGVIFLELAGDKARAEELVDDLGAMDGVASKLVVMPVPN
jgi:hypothetical protein